jgi:hypothetical protein
MFLTCLTGTEYKLLTADLENLRFAKLWYSLVFFFLVSWGGVRLSSLGTSATDWPIVPAPDDG